jgi:hypothetical protein
MWRESATHSQQHLQMYMIILLNGEAHYSGLNYSFFGKNAGRRHNETEGNNNEKPAEGIFLA